MSIRTFAGLPDGNGHGLNVRKLVATAAITAVAGIAAVGAARAAWAQMLTAVEATTQVYSLPPVVHGPAGKPDLGLVNRVVVLEAKAAPALTADAIAQAVLRAMDEKQKALKARRQP